MYCLDIWNKECFKQSCLSGIQAQFLFTPESRVSVPCQSIELDKQASHSLQQEPEAPHPLHATGLASHSPWLFTLLSGVTLVWPCMAFRVLLSMWLIYLDLLSKCQVLMSGLPRNLMADIPRLPTGRRGGNKNSLKLSEVFYNLGPVWLRICNQT